MSDQPRKGHPAFHAAVAAMGDLHELKSGGYGTGSDPFANFTTVAAASGRNRWEYPVERIIEKCTRIQSLTAQNRFDELREEFRDVMGLAGCCDAMLEDDHYQDVAGDPGFEEMFEPPVPGRPATYLRVDPEIERERRWREEGVGLTD